MSIILDGTTGVTTPGVTNSGNETVTGTLGVSGLLSANASLAVTGTMSASGATSLAALSATTGRFSGNLNTDNTSWVMNYTVNPVVQAGQVSMYGDGNQSFFTHNAYYASGWKSTSNAAHTQLFFDNTNGFAIRYEGASAGGAALTWPMTIITGSATGAVTMPGGGGLAVTGTLGVTGVASLGTAATGYSYETTVSVVELKYGNSIGSGNFATNTLQLNNNSYQDSGGYKFGGTGYAQMYFMTGGSHNWRVSSASGTLGNAITYRTIGATDTTGNWTFSPAGNTAAVISTTGMAVTGTLSNSTDFTCGGTGYVTNMAGGTVMNVKGAQAGGYAMGLQHTHSNPVGMYIYYSTDTNDASHAVMRFDGAANVRYQLFSNGGIANVQANNTNTSDVRLKKNIELAGNYLDKICAIPVKTFLYKDQTDEFLNLGVIAQDVEAVAPELIDSGGFGETPEDGTPLKAIYQTDLQFALMKAIQELAAKVVKLEAAQAAPQVEQKTE